MKSMKSTVERTDEEEILQILGEKSPVGVCIIQDGKFRYFNSNFPIAIGYTADELVGKDPLELIVPEDREMVRENEIKMLKGELLSPYQFRVIHKDGSIRWVIEAVRSIQYHGRRAVLGSYMEVTERKQMEEALKESEEKYRELANSITNVFFAMDEHLRYTYWNRASEILTGIRAEDAVGKSLREIFPDEPWRRRAEKVYRKVLKTQQPQTFVNDYDIDGRHYVFEISAYPSRGGVSVFVKDITEHKRAEEELKESERKYRLLFETSLDCIAQLDKEGRYLDANPATAKSLGVPSEELIGKTVFEVVPQEVAQLRLENMRKALDEGQPQIFEDERAGKYFQHIIIPTKISDQKEGIQAITRDITEHKQAIEALRQSEERYRTILEEMEDSYFEVDLGGHLTFVNSATCRKLGYSKEELIGTSYKKTTLKDDIESVFRIFNKVYRTGKPNKSCLWTTVCKDGTHRLIEHSAFPLRNDKGEIIGFRGVGRDITERKQAEEKLQLSEERYRALFDSSVIGTLLLDAETMQVLMGNEAALKIFGFSSAEEGAGINVLDLVPQEDRELNRELIKRELFEQDSRQDYDVRAITKDGREIWINVTGVRMMHKGRLVGMVTFIDVTERKQAEEALRQSEERYRTILEDMEDAYFEVDLGGHLTFVNNSVCRDLGYSKEELIGMSYKGFTATEDIESVFRVFNEVYQTGVPNKGFPWKVIRKDGSHGFAEASISPLQNDKGEIIGFRGVGRDVTERKQAEEALRQSEENYKTLFNSSVVGMYVMDAETMKVVMGNRAAREIIGFSSAEEGIGVNPFDFVVPEDREKVLGIAINEFLQDSRQTHEIRVMDKNGRRRWQSISIARIMHRGRLASLVSFTDITERKQMEEALRQSEENYRALFDSSVIGTFVLDAETMKVVMGNEAAMKLAGLDSPSEGIGINPFDFVIPEDRERILEIVNKELFEQDLRRIHEFRAITKDGKKIWISITGARIMHGGKLAGLISFTDITERKQMEEALQAEKNKLQSIIDAMQDDLTIQDTEYNVTFQNELARINTGGDQVGQKCYRAYEGNENICEDCPVEKSFKDGKSHTSERQRVLPSGELSFWETISNPILDASGRIIACLEIGRNITERKKQEQALADELTRRRLLIDQSLDGIVVLDVAARVVEANHRFAEMLGYTLEEVYKLHTWDWDKNFPPEKILEMGRNVDEKGLHLETKHTRKDGSVIDVDISINGATCAGQKLIFCVCRDATASKKMAEALKLAAQEWSRTFDSISDAISIHDKDFRILRANKAFADLFRKGLNEIINIHCYELHKGKEPRSGCPHQHTLTTGKPAATEFYESHLGKYLLESTSPIFNEQGEVVATVHITRDITEQKQQNERLMMTDRLASLGELAAGTAHELNNPLTSIIGFSQLLVEREVPDDIRDDLKLIYSEAQRAANVTKDLLTFARKHAPVKQHNQINYIIEDVLQLRAHVQENRGIEVERHLAPDLPEIMVDYFQMQQVFMNIIINAEYFMTEAHKKGTLTITTKKQNNSVMISFADDGPGIPQENLKRIFDPFFTTKEAGKGTGLGLSICHGIVTEHGGQIYVRSQLGKGATIFIELPIDSRHHIKRIP